MCKRNCIKDSVFIDDGKTGTNFERQEFSQMISDVEQGLISRVIVKDASRFGRNMTMVGYYTDLIFTKYDVEFISISEPDVDFLPLHNFVNEQYSKDCSRKIRAVIKHNGNTGKRLTTNPPYGYKKGIDKSGKKNWIIDENVADTVRLIFDLYANQSYGVMMISRELEKRKKITPNAYNPNRFISDDKKYFWNTATITKILSNQCYCGDTVNFKTEVKSYKDKRKTYFDPSEYKIFPDTHEPIIDRELFQIAQDKLKLRRRYKHIDKENYFKNLIFCADCMHPLYISRSRNNNGNRDMFICSTYTKSRAINCSSHSINENYLISCVIEIINKLVNYRNENKDYIKSLNKLLSKKINLKKVEYEQRVSDIDTEISTLNTRLKNLYLEKERGEISKEVFSNLANQFNIDLEELQPKRLDYVRKQREISEDLEEAKKFIKILKNLTEISYDDLNEKFLSSLISRIEVDERQIKCSRKQPTFKVFFRGIGYLDFI